MYRKILLTVVIVLLLVVETAVVRADGEDLGYAWNGHAAPFNFKFGNLIDSHQQTRLLPNGRLQGYIYIQFTGEEIDGMPVARRADCNNPNLDCRVGWEVTGVPMSGAILVQKGPRIWDIPEANLPSDPEFVHFQWFSTPMKPCGLVLNTLPYTGYLFKRTAVTTFYWLGGNDDKEVGRLVTPGIDLHSNLLGRWTGGGMHDGGGEEPGGETDGCGGHESGGETGGEEPGGCSGGEMGGCEGH